MLPEYFEFLNPVKLLCGSGALENIPYELDRLGVKKPLALVSRTLLEEGVIERIGGKLEAVIQSDIPKDSSFSLVDSVAKRAREEGCDGVLAIGGGSVLDTAKAVRALIARGEASADDYPLLLHVDDIIERGKAVDIPWNKFELETL